MTIINVAVLTDFYFFSWSFQDFIDILDGYKWRNGLYNITVKKLDWHDTIKDLKPEKFDVVIIPAADTFLIYLKSLFSPTAAYKWKNTLNHFVKKGGGVVAHCAGALLFCKLLNHPKTFSEILSNSERGKAFVLKTKLLWNISIPPFDQILSGNPGESAYVYYTGMNTTVSGEQTTGGIPIKVKINRKHPIFRDYKNNFCLVRWIGGPALIPEKNSDVLAYFPDKKVFNGYRIHRWRFTCWRRYIKTVLGENLKFLKKNKNPLDLPLRLVQTSWKQPCWEKTEEIIPLNIPNHPAMVAETYGRGRVVLSSFHSEKPVWDTSKTRLKEVDDNKGSLWDAIVYWKNLTKDKMKRETDWMVRREVAWASGKVPPEELPPIG